MPRAMLTQVPGRSRLVVPLAEEVALDRVVPLTDAVASFDSAGRLIEVQENHGAFRAAQTTEHTVATGSAEFRWS